MISALVPLILEAALRALLAAVAVWAGLRLLGVGNVLVQKAAWGLVLVAALAMPLLPRWQGIPASAELRLPALPWGQMPVSAVASPSAPAEPAEPMNQAATAPQSTTRPIPSELDRIPAAAISSSHSPFNPPVSSAPPARSAPDPAHYASRPISVPQPGASNSSPIRLAALAWLLYLGVFSALLLRLLFGLASALRLWMTAKPVAGPPASGTAAGLSLRFSSHVASPVNIGSGIVLPAGYAAVG